MFQESSDDENKLFLPFCDRQAQDPAKRIRHHPCLGILEIHVASEKTRKRVGRLRVEIGMYVLQ